MHKIGLIIPIATQLLWELKWDKALEHGSHSINGSYSCDRICTSYASQSGVSWPPNPLHHQCPLSFFCLQHNLVGIHLKINHWALNQWEWRSHDRHWHKTRQQRTSTTYTNKSIYCPVVSTHYASSTNKGSGFNRLSKMFQQICD